MSLFLGFVMQLTVFIPAHAQTTVNRTYDLTQDFYGFVNIGDKELYVDYQAPQKAKPTIILLNGLTYSTRQWDAMTYYFKKLGVGVLRYDMDGQGRTLLKYGVRAGPYPYMDQVQDLNNLLKTLKMKAPYDIAGLSYGGGILAAYAFKYPKKMNNVILMAPYTQPLVQQDQWIRSQIWATRQMYPYNPYSDDELYDYFLKQIAYATYPSAEPIVLENPLKLEGVFRMTQGIRKFNVLDQVDQFPAKSVHLLIAEYDQYIPRDVLVSFWDAIPKKAKAKESYDLIRFSEHKVPEAVPKVAAELIYNIIK